MIHIIISIAIITMLTGCIRLTFVDQPPVSKQTEITEEEKTEIEKLVEDGVETITNSVGVEIYKDF